MGVTPNLELSIERLVLHGLTPAQGHLLREAVEQELTRILAEEGIPPGLAAGGHLARLPGGSFDVPPGAKPAAVAAQVARSIYGGMGGGAAPTPGGKAAAPGGR